ncbi:MAG: lysostaphin resistance A-like protein [Halobacteriaceae archaeon]
MDWDQRGRLSVFGICLAVAISGFILGLAIVIVGLNILAATGIAITPVILLTANFIALQGIAFPVVATIYLLLVDPAFRIISIRIPSFTDIEFAIGSFVLAFVAAIVFSIIISTTGSETASNQAAEIALENPWIIPYLIPAMLLIVGPGEELLYRGVLQGTFRQKFNKWPSILLANLLFAPAHVPALQGSIQAVFLTISFLTLPGIIFGYAYERTENLIVPALAHGLYNATLFGLIYLSIRYGGSTSMIAPPPLL